MTQLNNKLNDIKISFIGGGNMAQALISGLLAKGIAPSLITVADPSDMIRDKLSKQGLTVIDPMQDATAAIDDADVVILAVKPQVMRSVVAPFVASLDKQLVISVAAGLSSQTLSQMLGGYPTIIRAMPNTPAMIQMGATGLYAGGQITDAQKQLATEILNAVGLVIWVADEVVLHTVTAVSGSAPAYFFYFIESIVKAGVAMGLDETQANQLAIQTALGSAQMAQTSDDTPATLRRKVTSPNGTTQAAIESFAHADLDAIVNNAMQACYKRSEEMSQELGEDKNN